MPKTVTLKIDDDKYNLIKLAASAEKRLIPDFIKYATMTYLSEKMFVTAKEMDEIMNNKKLLKRLLQANKEIKAGQYRIVG